MITGSPGTSPGVASTGTDTYHAWLDICAVQELHRSAGHSRRRRMRDGQRFVTTRTPWCVAVVEVLCPGRSTQCQAGPKHLAKRATASRNAPQRRASRPRQRPVPPRRADLPEGAAPPCKRLGGDSATSTVAASAARRSLRSQFSRSLARPPSHRRQSTDIVPGLAMKTLGGSAKSDVVAANPVDGADDDRAEWTS